MSVADILEQLARNAGRRPSTGAMIGTMIGQATQIPGAILVDHEQQRVLAAQRARQLGQDQRQARGDAREESAFQAAQRQAAIGHEVATVYYAGNPNDPDPRTNDLAGAEAKALELGAPELIPQLRETHRKNLAAARPKLEQFDPTKPIYADGVLQTPGVPAAKPDYNLGPNRYSGADNSLIVSAPTPEKAPTHSGIYNEWQDHLAAGGKQTFEQYQNTDANRRRPVVNVSGMNTMNAATDPAAIADMIRSAKFPPDISTYGRAAQGAISSALAKKGPNGEPPFDLASASREWKAQVKLNSTMNGPQQVRLDESIRSGLAMYDKVDEIAAQWNGMGLGPLSRANLKAAKDGLLGPKAASIANQLAGQIGQLTSDIATIEQGGLTPTNESRAVAEKSMQDWWGKGTINDMTAQGRYNMQIRHKARNTQDIMVPGNGVDERPAVAATPGGRGTPPAARPAGGLIEALDEQGKIHHAPAGTALPPGWRLKP